MACHDLPVHVREIVITFMNTGCAEDDMRRPENYQDMDAVNRSLLAPTQEEDLL